ncbi:MAG TPA: FHA domain-containing protein [Dehalococcoidia bacterium]|nr:FHA domain-containing protein [Dehalococcoidia bacterium]
MTSTPNATMINEKGLPGAGPIHIDRDVSIFGKSPTVDVNLDNQYVSRRHFQVRSQDGVFFITDLDSTNGTFLNGERLTPHEERRLRDQDLIGLAGDQVVFRFLDPVKTLTIDFPPMSSTAPQSNAELDVSSGSRDVWVRGEKLAPPLSKKEFDMLELLYLERGNAVGRDDIARAGWPERPEGDVTPEEIDQYISRLRRRIEEDPSQPKLIVTLRGHGYRIP